MAIFFSAPPIWEVGNTVDLSFANKHYMHRCHTSCMVFGYVLRRRFERVKGLDSNVIGLVETDIDKTMRLLNKVWTERPLREERAKAGLIADFPVSDYDAKHGHRIAFIDKDKNPRSVLDTMHIFDKYAQTATAILSVHSVEKAWGRINLYEPQVHAADLLPLIRRRVLDESDIRFLENFGDACGKLREQEIIAVGRHETAEATRQSLLWEFTRWHDWMDDALNALFEFLKSNNKNTRDRAAINIWQCWSFALECKKKAGILTGDIYGSDVVFYKDGLQALKEAMIELNLDPSLLRGHQPFEGIWRDSGVQSLGFPAFGIWSFTNYFAGTLRSLDAFKSTLLGQRVSSITREETEKAFYDSQRFVWVPPDSRPLKFSESWWRSLEVRPKKDFDLIAPTIVWESPENLAKFLSSARSTVDWLTKTYIIPDIGSLREQKA